MDRVAEDDDIAAPNGLVGQHLAPAAAAGEVDLVDQQVVADEQRIFHGLGGDLEGLGQEGDDEDGDDQGHQQGLQGAQYAGGQWAAGGAGSRVGGGGFQTGC